MRFLKEDSVLVVIDMQEKLLPHMANKDQIVSNTKKLITGAIELGVPIIYSQQYTRGLGNTVEEIARLQPHFTYIEKTSFSCMKSEDFKNEILRRGRKNVIVCGIEAHVCVLQTAVELVENLYHTVVVKDCVSSRKEADMETGFVRMQQEGILATTCESILFELLATASDEHFKAISKLVK